MKINRTPSSSTSTQPDAWRVIDFSSPTNNVCHAFRNSQQLGTGMSKSVTLRVERLKFHCRWPESHRPYSNANKALTGTRHGKPIDRVNRSFTRESGVDPAASLARKQSTPPLSTGAAHSPSSGAPPLHDNAHRQRRTKAARPAGSALSSSCQRPVRISRRAKLENPPPRHQLGAQASERASLVIFHRASAGSDRSAILAPVVIAPDAHSSRSCAAFARFVSSTAPMRRRESWSIMAV